MSLKLLFIDLSSSALNQLFCWRLALLARSIDLSNKRLWHPLNSITFHPKVTITPHLLIQPPPHTVSFILQPPRNIQTRATIAAATCFSRTNRSGSLGRDQPVPAGFTPTRDRTRSHVPTRPLRVSTPEGSSGSLSGRRLHHHTRLLLLFSDLALFFLYQFCGVLDLRKTLGFAFFFCFMPQLSLAWTPTRKI